MKRNNLVAVIAIVALAGFLWMTCESSTSGEGGDGTSPNGWNGGKPGASGVTYTILVEKGDSTTVPYLNKIENVPSSATVDYSLISTPPSPSDTSGNLLRGWRITDTDEDFVFFNAPFGGDPTKVIRNITIEPVYTAPIIITLTVVNNSIGTGGTFYGNSFSAAGTAFSIPTGGVIPKAANPKALSGTVGTVQTGWFSRLNGGDKIEIGKDTFPRATTLYAQYAHGSTITFDLAAYSGLQPSGLVLDEISKYASDGTGSKKITLPTSAALGFPASLPNFTWGGWWYDDYGTEWVQGTTEATYGTNYELKPKFNTNITYDIKGGTGTLPPSVSAWLGQSFPLASVSHTKTDLSLKDGLDQWWKLVNGTGTSIVSPRIIVPADGNLGLYLRWVGLITLNEGQSMLDESDTLPSTSSVVLDENTSIPSISGSVVLGFPNTTMAGSSITSWTASVGTSSPSFFPPSYTVRGTANVYAQANYP